MTKIEDIKQTLSRMSELLRIGGDNDWGMALEKFGGEMSRTPDETARRILSLYGGMGSLNDLVLYKDGLLLSKENEEFYSLRSHLFAACNEYL